MADTSKKVRAVKRSLALAGKHKYVWAPYGYNRNDDDKCRIDVCDETADIVREIFRRYIGGEVPTAIARDLNARGVPSPSSHICHNKHSAIWAHGSVVNILENSTYIGTRVQQRYTTPSYKIHKTIIRPQSDWVVEENHHEAIISVEDFELAQRIRNNGRRRKTNMGELPPLSGLMFCRDCGAKMRLHRSVSETISYYTCANYCGRNSACTSHRLRLDVVTTTVISALERISGYILANEAEFVKQVRAKFGAETAKSLKAKQSELSRAKNRMETVDKAVKKIFEQTLTGTLDDDTFAKLARDYKTEREQRKIIQLETELAVAREEASGAERFVKLVRKHSNFTELTTELARTLIERIIVHEAVGTPRSQNKQQTIEIVWNFIGKLNLLNEEEKLETADKAAVQAQH